MLEGTVLDQLLRGDLGVAAREAEGEAEVDLGRGVRGRGAEFDDVAEAFGLAVHALYAVVFFGGPAGVG